MEEPMRVVKHENSRNMTVVDHETPGRLGPVQLLIDSGSTIHA
jgi:hypothetical protein